ncbi:MAG: dihydrofolate reductase family protein [Pseudobdellovibrio sp.]
MQRKLIIISFLTLDGVMQAPGGKDEDTEGGFKHGGWQMSFSRADDDENTMLENLKQAGALLLGRKTYDNFAAYWPTTGKDVPWFGEFMNSIPKYVASKTLQKTDWQNSVLLESNTIDAIAKLKKENGKDIYVIGSGHLSQTLMQNNLVDEYVQMIYPITLGEGKRLFQNNHHKQNLELIKSKISKNGILVLNYKVKWS